MPERSRTLARVAAWITFGAVATLAIAWSRAATATFGVWTHSGGIPDPRRPDHKLWAVGRIDIVGGSLVFALPKAPGPDRVVRPPSEFIPDWSNLLGSLDMLPDGTPAPGSDFSASWHFKEAGFGWPLIALRASWRDDQLLRGIALPPDSGRARALPTEVLPARFLIDAVMLGALGWGLAASPGALIRRFRRLKGRCARCGYQLGGSASPACPECGSAEGVRPPED